MMLARSLVAILVLGSTLSIAAAQTNAPTSGAKPSDPPAASGSKTAEKPTTEKKTEPPATKPAEKPASTPATTDKPKETPPAKPGATGDPSVDQIIKDMERDGAKRDTIAPARPATTEPASPDAGKGKPQPAVSGRLLREGTFLASRRGRMIRSSGGDWVLTFDADAQGKADAPMTLMPCLNLMGMEKLAERGGESTTFTVSGQVFVYHGRNYLLPTLYFVNRRTDLSGG